MTRKTFVICIKNPGLTVSLNLRKIYEVLEDEQARELGMFRVIDETGEDYLFPQEYFVPINLPGPAAALFSHAA